MEFRSNPSEFDQHRAVMLMHQGSPRESLFENKSGRIVHQPKGAFRTNDGEHVRIAMLAHLANAPAWLFAKEIAPGSLRRLLPVYEQPKSIFALRPGGRRLTTKVRVLIEFLEATFTEDLATITKDENLPIHRAEVTR